MQRLLTIAALIATGIMLAACDSGRSDPPNASVLVVHADPTLGTVTFRRVNVNNTPLEFKNSSVFSFDVDTYTFNFDISAPDGTISETVSTVQTLEEETNYIVVLWNAAGNPTVRVLDAPLRAGFGGAQVQLLHTAATIDTVDVYVELEGFDVLAATPWGRVSAGEALPPTVFDSGTYELALTAPDDPTTVLLRSTSFALGGAENLLLFIADTNGEGLASFTVPLATGSGEELLDSSIESAIRVLNAVNDRSAIDAGIDLELAPPLIPNILFGTISDQAIVSVGDHTATITPAGDPGVIELDEAFEAIRGAIGTLFVFGSPGSLEVLFVPDDARVISGEAKLRIFNASPLNNNVDVFVLPPGTSPAAANLTAVTTNGNVTINVRLAPGDYELTVRTAGANTVLAGPTPITVTAEGYYSILLADPLSGSGVDVVFLDDFN
jgi:hypothetical protein